MTDTEAQPTVTRNDDDRRYEIHVGGVLAGFTVFRIDARGRLHFPHTEVDPAFRGRGLAQAVVGEAMADAARRGETVVPHCPVVAEYLREHEVPGLTVEWPDARRTPSERRPDMTRLDADDAVATESVRRVRRTAGAAARDARGAARRRPRDGGAPLAAAARSAARRRVVLPRPLRTAGRRACASSRIRTSACRPSPGRSSGEVRHRDTVGSDVVVRRGALNLMTSGAGIAHSEYSVGEDAVTPGRPAAVGRPARGAASRRPGVRAARGAAGRSRCRRWTGPRVRRPSCSASSAGVASPATAYTPIVGAELRIPAGVTRARAARTPRGSTRWSAVDGEAAVAGEHRASATRCTLDYRAPAVPRHPPRRGRGHERRGCDAVPPRRRAVRGRHRDVVELRRPLPRRDRRGARGVGSGRPRASATSSTTATSASPHRRCPPCG